MKEYRKRNDSGAVYDARRVAVGARVDEVGAGELSQRGKAHSPLGNAPFLGAPLAVCHRETATLHNDSIDNQLIN